MWDETFETVDEFIDHLLGDSYRSPRVTIALVAGKGEGSFIFRGQSWPGLPLLPSAHRLGTSPPLASQAFQGLDTEPPESEERRLQYIGTFVYEELRAVKIFLETADKLGLPTPIDYHHFAAHKEHIDKLWNHKDVGTLAQEFPTSPLLPAFALAQHHGVPTRLLDWTESPLVAAYFAAVGVSSVGTRQPRYKEDRIAVIRLSAALLDSYPQPPDAVPIRLVYAPRAPNSHLRAQRGLFTLITNANQFLYTHGRWPSVEDVAGQKLSRLTLPASRADELLRRLYDLGISRHELFPTLDQAASAVQYARTLFPPRALPPWSSMGHVVGRPLDPPSNSPVAVLMRDDPALCQLMHQDLEELSRALERQSMVGLFRARLRSSDSNEVWQGVLEIHACALVAAVADSVSWTGASTGFIVNAIIGGIAVQGRFFREPVASSVLGVELVSGSNSMPNAPRLLTAFVELVRSPGMVGRKYRLVTPSPLGPMSQPVVDAVAREVVYRRAWDERI